MRRTPHLSTNPGKRVRLKLRDGTTVEGKYVEKTGSMHVVIDVDGIQQRHHAKTIDKFLVVKTTIQTSEPPGVSHDHNHPQPSDVFPRMK